MLMLAAGVAHGQRHPNLVAWWRAENTGADASGNGLTATLTNGMTYTAGKLSRAFSLDGVDDHALLGDAPALRLSTNFTIAAWAYMTDTGTNRVIISKGFASKKSQGVQQDYMLMRHSGNTFRFFVSTAADSPNTTWGTDVATAATVSSGGWYHVCVVQDSTSARIYLNGILGNTDSTPSVPRSSTEAAYIGYRDTNNSNYGRGQIDELMIFNAALSASDIRRVMLGLMPAKRY